MRDAGFALAFVPKCYSPEDQRANVERAVALGASPCDIGQGDVPWVVLADPEGSGHM